MTRAKNDAGRRAWSVGSLPTTLCVLHVGTPSRTAARLREALADDGACQVTIEEADSDNAGASRLREEQFDAVLIRHQPPELDALELVEALRAAGCDDPLVVLSDDADDELAVLAAEVGADACLLTRNTLTRGFLWTLARSIERQHLIRENRRLESSQRRRNEQDRGEAERLLADQRAVIQDLEPIAIRDMEGDDPGHEPPAVLPVQASQVLAPELVKHYGELLRAYVVMGSGTMSAELKDLAGLLAVAGLSARETLSLHLHVVERMIEGLGSRSGRHVMSRADLLVLEVMLHLADNYREAFRQCIAPRAASESLPAFDEAA